MQPQNFGRKITSFIKSMDRYGKKIEFNYRGDTTFKTVFGGSLTMVSFMIILGFFVSQLFKVIGKQNVISYTSLKRNLVLNSEELTLNKNNFDIAVFIQNFENKTQDMEEYFVVGFGQG